MEREEEAFEEFEDEDEELGEETEVRKPLPKLPPARPQPMRKPQPQPQEIQEIKKAVQRKPIEEDDDLKLVEHQPQQVSAEDLVAALQNHEQRLTAIESALFRLRGAI